MAFSYPFGKDRIVGIDIGSACIKILELEPSGSAYSVAKAVTHPTPPGSCHDGMINDVPAVTQAIREALAFSDINATGAIAAVSGSQVLVRQVQLPKMPEAVVRKSIRFEAAKYISTNVDESIVEFEIIDPDCGEGQMQLMLVAVPQDLVESRVSVLEGAGLEPLIVDIEAFALMRSLVEFSSDTSVTDETVALVDMGAAHTDLNIVAGGRFALTRSIPIAGASLTQAIKSLAGCDEAEAESLKRRLRIGPALMEDAANNPPDENILKAARAIQPLLDELLREIRRSLHFYQNQFPEGNKQAVVTRLLLTGGASQMVGLPEYISAKLNLRTSMVNVLKDGIIQPGALTDEQAAEQGALLSVAAGLSLKPYIPVRLPMAA